MTYTYSKTWVAPEMAEKERYAIVKANLERMNLVPRSPFLPRTLAQWIEHRVEWSAMVAAKERRKLRLMKENYEDENGKPRPKIFPAFGGKRFNDNRSAVLALPTIWCPWAESTYEHPRAPWPSQEEMKEEGDERNSSIFRRFPALPRVPGNETVVYKQKNLIVSYPMDKVWELPTLEAEIPPEDDERMEELLGIEMMKLLDPK